MALGQCAPEAINNNVEPGIADTTTYIQLLQDKNVAFVGNHTSYYNRTHSLDILRRNGINVTKIFAPEHGFRGTEDAGATISNEIDVKTGIPIISLYGKTKKPSPEHLKGIESIIFDIQDVGVRFYTYLSTLHYIMEAAAESDIPVIVMDRPNPHCYYIDGPVLDTVHSSFVGLHPVPIVYGMTIGEYAQMINGEGWLKDGVKCNLTIIPITGEWNRAISTPLQCKPSPNLPDSVSVMLYPSMCLFEGTVISEGRGTYIPFQCFGHPELSNMPYSFTPKSIKGMSTSPKCKDQLCHGMLLDTCYNEVYNGARLQLKWLITAYKNYKGKEPFFNNFFTNLSGTTTLRKQIEDGLNEEEIRQSWQTSLNNFKTIRQKYLIY